MFKMYLNQLTLILTAASLVVGYCPRDKIHSTGNCSYRIHCIGNIRGVRLPDQCMEASNEPVNIDLTLTEAVERFDERIDKEFLAVITTLRISGKWPKTKLTLLQYTTRLENLFLIGDHIESIHDKPFYYLNMLDILDLSHNNLSQVDSLFRFELQPNKLRKLYLSHNKIKTVTDSFAELTFLAELDLSDNLISDLTEEPFSNLTNLEILRLNNNKITNLNGAVNNLHNLQHLYLKGNQINNIDDESLKIVTHLKTFDVSLNNLERISSVMFLRHWNHFGNHAVCKIILSGNHITSVPNATAREITTRFVRHLVRGRSTANMLSQTDSVELDLSKNEISNIEYNAFQSLIRLISLDLSHNKLKDFLVDANDVVYVRTLNLSGNNICQLYFESFSQMNSLQNLDLSYNRLDYIPKETFHKNYNLRHVNMTHNAIEQLDNLHINMFHIDGGVLDLSENGLSRLKIPSGEGLRLTYLILHSNNITDAGLVDLYYQTDLKILDMSRNQIRELNEKSLRLPVSLTYLNLNFNRIVNIAPSTFLRVWHLKTLLLSHNLISNIEYGAFRGLSVLSKLDLSYNRLKMLDSKLMMDLKSLSSLYLNYNGLLVLYDEGWYGHKTPLAVYLDGSNFTCEWLAAASKNYNNGFSKMRPTVLNWTATGHTLEGIPCTPEGSELASIREQNKEVMADERLLMTSQKILEAIREQTYYMKKYIWRSIQDDAERVKSFS